jgi:xanthine dehydrogenase accessory factor
VGQGPAFDPLLPEWPAFGYADDMRPALFRRREAGETCVLATLVAVDGSGPRPLGSQMVFGPTDAAGFLSGGCVEADLALHAREVAGGGAPKLVRYGRGSPYPDVRLVCGSGITVLLERLAPDDAAGAALLDAARARRPALWLSDGTLRACVAAGDEPPAHFAALADTAARSDEPAGLVGEGLVWRRSEPPWRLVVVGADPTAMAVAQLGREAGFDATLFRPKGPQGPPPVGEVAYLRGADVAATITDLAPDAWTAVAICTHDEDLDHQATAAALGTPAAYVGALGARRRLPQRLRRLREAGLAETDIARLRAPIGIALGGKAPWEIAVSVIADIVRVRYRQAG